MNAVNVNLDFDKPNQFALEMTKSYLYENSDNLYRSPREYVAVFAGTYARILAEFEKFKADEDLLKSIVTSAMNVDLSMSNSNKED